VSHLVSDTSSVIKLRCLIEQLGKACERLQVSMAVGKGIKTAVVCLLFTLPLFLLEGGVPQNGPERSRARRCCAAKRTLDGEDRSEILLQEGKVWPKWTAKMGPVAHRL
jgi:hypothetical protein